MTNHNTNENKGAKTKVPLLPPTKKIKHSQTNN